MFHHLLVFTDDDCAKLKMGYHALMQKLEIGKEIEKPLIDELSETMRVILQSQQGLLPFWKQVQKDPAKNDHLHLTHHDKELLNLPWQLAIDTKRYPSIRISKGSTAITSSHTYQPQPGPLRILVMISSPEDLNYNKRLSYEEEEQHILKALSSLWIAGQVQVHFTEDGSLANLQEKLKQQHYHILYFSGHGIYKNNTGYLQLEDPLTFRSEEVNAQQLVRAVKDAALNIPPLIILSSCQTAQGSNEEGFRGVADELIHEGVPAVIAMAFSIKDRFNIAFVGHLYEQLANKRPLPEACSTALHNMRMQEQQELESAGKKKYYPGQWLIPQLYVSRPVVHIVNWQQEEQSRYSTHARFMEGANGLLLPHNGDYRFIGRRRECARLLNELVHGKPVLITGQGGIGKTALAEYLVKRLIVQNAAYYCFAFNETTIGIGPMASQLLQYLKKADPQYDASYEAEYWDNRTRYLDFLVKRVTGLCKPVWVFDNMESYQKEAGDLLKNEYREWMNYVQQHLFSGYPVLFISRFEIPEWKTIFTTSLNQAPYIDFYSKCMQLDLRSLHTQLRLPELDDVASLLYDLFGGNYRTLEFLNELFVNNRDKTLGLLQQIIRLNEEKSARELMQDVQQMLQNFSRQMVLTELISSLTHEEQKTLHLLLYFDRPVLPLALEMQKPGKNFEADLQQLKNATLVEEQTDKETGFKLYSVGPLVKNSVEGIDLPQVYFYPQLAGDYFFKAFEMLLPYNELESALEQYKLCNNIPKLNEAGVILTNKYQRMGLHDATLYYGTFVEAVAGDETAGDILNNIGLTHWTFGNSRQALTYFTKFSIACRKEKDDKKLGVAFNGIGQAYVQMQNYDTAMEWLEKSIRLSRATKDKKQEAVTLSNMGIVYCEIAEYGKAMKVFEQSLKIRKKINDRLGQIKVLNNICRIYDDHGDLQKSRETLQEALSIAIEIDNKHQQGALLNNIGCNLMEIKDFKAALVCFQKNLAVSESIDDEEEIGKAQWGMGLAYRRLDKYDEAVDYLTKGALILQKYDYKEIETQVLYQLGTVYVYRGDAAESLPLLQMALTGYRNEKKKKEEAQTLYYMGHAYLYLDDIDNAIKHLEECLFILQKVDDKETEGMALVKLGQAYAVKNDADKALDAQEKNLALRQAVGDRTGEAVALFNMAQAYLEKGLPDMYLHYALEAYSIYSEENDLGGLYFTSSMLGTFLCTNFPEKYSQQGLWFLEQAYEIGIQSADFPRVELIGVMIDEWQKPPGKKKTARTKKTSANKKAANKKTAGRKKTSRKKGR